MELTAEAVARVFQLENPNTEAMSHLLRERWEAFVETLKCEFEYFSGEDDLWPEAEIIGGL